MLDAATRKRFEQLALAHLDAAYNLARRLTRNEQDAEDLVQEAYLRALQAFARFQGRARQSLDSHHCAAYVLHLATPAHAP